MLRLRWKLYRICFSLGSLTPFMSGAPFKMEEICFSCSNVHSRSSSSDCSTSFFSSHAGYVISIPLVASQVELWMSLSTHTMHDPNILISCAQSWLSFNKNKFSLCHLLYGYKLKIIKCNRWKVLWKKYKIKLQIYNQKLYLNVIIWIL